MIGYHFTDPHQLEIALTHSSVRTPDRECNERLEFLGDSVLGLAITDELYRRLPDQQEGELTRIKSAVVSRGALYRASTRMGLVRFIEVAKGVGRREELPVSLTANLVESIIGAIYVDAGFFPAREFILRHLAPELDDVLNDRVAKNYKSLLQHEAQERMGVTPVYRTLEAEGPDHRRSFTVAAILRGTEYGRAEGINKKEAEQEAARHALEALQRSGRGRRRRSDGRGEPRGDVRAADARDREPARERDGPVGEREDDAWRTWAESGRPGAPTAVPFGASLAAGPASVPPRSVPYAIEPEADDGWSDGPPIPRADTIAEPAPRPSVDAGPPPAPGADPSEPRGRRRRRGRGRGRAPSLDDGVLDAAGADVLGGAVATVPAEATSPARSLADVFSETPVVTPSPAPIPSPPADAIGASPRPGAPDAEPSAPRRPTRGRAREARSTDDDAPRKPASRAREPARRSRSPAADVVPAAPAAPAAPVAPVHRPSRPRARRVRRASRPRRRPRTSVRASSPWSPHRRRASRRP